MFHKLADEYAVAISAFGKNIVVVMASPYDLEDLAIGWLFSQQIIDSLDQVYAVDINIDHEAFKATIDLELASRCTQKLQAIKRPFMSAAGCGICGVEALEQALPEPNSLTASMPFPIEKLTRQTVENSQVVAKPSGALHAACLVDSDGEVLVCSEDVGRHNALDKLIGRLLSNEVDDIHQYAIVMTSRCGVELVYKAARIGVSYLVSFSAPSELALRTAEKAGLQLVHLTKHDGPIAIG